MRSFSFLFLLAGLALPRLVWAADEPKKFTAVPDSTLLHHPFNKADEKMFRNPDRIFYPETWFHFVNGNVSREGITRDLEAIAQSGIQGIQLFHGRMSDDVWPGTEEPIECLTPQWEDLVRHTATEAHRLGMRFSLQTCPGWAMSGGPWIKPEDAGTPPPACGARRTSCVGAYP